MSETVESTVEFLNQFVNRCVKLKERVDNLEQRLANIERLAARVTGPNEPRNVNSPAQAGIGEVPADFKAAADIEAETPICNAPPAHDAPPFHVGQVVECVDTGGASLLTLGKQYTVSVVEDDGSFVGFDELRDAGPEWLSSRFRPIPATAEQGPTEGMQAVSAHACLGQGDVGKNFLLRKMVEHIGPELAAKDAEITRLKADNVRLRDDYQVAVNNIGYRSGELNEARLEIERLKADHDKYHDATLGAASELKQQVSSLTLKLAEAEKHTLTNPGGFEGTFQGLLDAYNESCAAISVARDNPCESLADSIKHIVTQLSAATAANVERDRAAEAMEWLNEKRCQLIFGFNYGGTKGWFIGGDLSGTYTTPTDAILAAKAAAEGNG